MMLLKHLLLRNFRNYTVADIDFAQGVNAFCGINAQGKTSLLEAIFLCVSGRSYRSPHLSDLIQQGESLFFVELYFTKNGVEQRVGFGFDGKERKITYNTTCCQTTAQLLGVIPGVVLSPDDVALIKTGPQLRRQYLDLQIAQASPLYLHHLVRYQRAIRQRNHLLRTKTAATLEMWEKELSHSAAYLVMQRSETVADLNCRACSCYSYLTDEDETLHLRYKCQVSLEGTQEMISSRYLERYASQRTRDMELGWTSTGPHKDDVIIHIEGKTGRYFASEGQQRSCVTSLRIAEWQRLYHQCGYKPALLIDDIAVSLDAKRRKRLFELLQQMGQVMLSSAQQIETELTAKFFNVVAGSVVPI